MDYSNKEKYKKDSLLKIKKIKMKRKIKYFIKFILIIISFFVNKSIYNNNNKQILIEVDISKSVFDGEGPLQLVKSLRDVLPYETKKCKFIASNSITPKNAKNKSDLFFLPFPCLAESIYDEWNLINRSNSLLLGPYFVPNIWNDFPYKGFWSERRFEEILQTVKGVVVHSKRIRQYLSTKSNTTYLSDKYKFLRPCTGIMPKNVENFENRKIDILFYEKFNDLYRRKQSKKLIHYFRQTNLNIKILKSLNYTKAIDLANNTKFIIYYSFYDTGPIDLKRIQNFGVFCFTHEKDFVINKNTTFYIPELHDEDNMIPAFKKIMGIIRNISNSNPNTQLIAKINQDANRCERAFDDLCEGI